MKCFVCWGWKLYKPRHEFPRTKDAEDIALKNRYSPQRRKVRKGKKKNTGEKTKDKKLFNAELAENTEDKDMD